MRHAIAQRASQTLPSKSKHFLKVSKEMSSEANIPSYNSITTKITPHTKAQFHSD